MSWRTRSWQAMRFLASSFAASSTNAPSSFESAFHTSVGRSDFLAMISNAACQTSHWGIISGFFRPSISMRSEIGGTSKTTLGGVWACAGGPALAARTAGAAAASTAAIDTTANITRLAIQCSR
jgi:hypothetical protein